MFLDYHTLLGHRKIVVGEQRILVSPLLGRVMRVIARLISAFVFASCTVPLPPKSEISSL